MVTMWHRLTILQHLALSICRWESCFVDVVVESSLWQQSKEWLWIVTQVRYAVLSYGIISGTVRLLVS